MNMPNAEIPSMAIFPTAMNIAPDLKTELRSDNHMMVSLLTYLVCSEYQCPVGRILIQ